MTELNERCVECGGRCCNRFAVCVTPFDIISICETTGLAPLEFVKLEEDASVSTRGEPSFTLDGKEYLLCLERLRNEHCMFFHHSKGCAIYDARPRVCRIYPFMLDEKGELTNLPNTECPERWEPSEEEKSAFIADLQAHARELREYGKMTRKWLLVVKGKTPEEYLAFVLAEAKKL